MRACVCVQPADMVMCPEARTALPTAHGQHAPPTRPPHARRALPPAPASSRCRPPTPGRSRPRPKPTASTRCWRRARPTCGASSTASTLRSGTPRLTSTRRRTSVPTACGVRRRGCCAARRRHKQGRGAGGAGALDCRHDSSATPRPLVACVSVPPLLAHPTAGKTLCKRALQRELRLPPDPSALLLGFIGRLDHQKGPDLLIDALPALAALGVQVTGGGAARAATRRPTGVHATGGWHTSAWARAHLGAPPAPNPACEYQAPPPPLLRWTVPTLSRFRS